MQNSDYDSRVKQIIKIETILNYILRIALGASIIAFLLILFGGNAKAQDVQDIFSVPRVRSTAIGAQVFQPDTGAGYKEIEADNVLGKNIVGTPGNFAKANLNLRGGQGSVRNPGFNHQVNENLEYPIISNYRPPLYDPFESGIKKDVPIPPTPKQIPENVAFSIENAINGRDVDSGTTETVFEFRADVSRNSLVRWDINSDGEFESYFSGTKSFRYLFEEPGVYQITMEALNQAGEISSASKYIKVVENTPPVAVFFIDKLTAPINSILKLDTSLSYDNQYALNELWFRFDWNGDGFYDTDYKNKTIWRHRFQEIGKQTIRMEAVDPEGATSTSSVEIEILEDSAPVPRLMIENLKNGRFHFDATASTDDYTDKLRYRWDFNYNGESDIMFDTNWSFLPRYNYTYELKGERMVRLQVMDEQGQVSQKFARIKVV
ncbi:hypothetical protein GF376_02980 [Candidatus Peregrinibacteria bacterium]|nr:hypothetical protein [Candidatus Peregrinibacteria bacterium]